MRQAVAGGHRQHDPGQVQRVVKHVSGNRTIGTYKVREVEATTVGDNGAVADEVDQLSKNLLRRWRRGDIGIPYSGQLLDRGGDWNSGSSERLEASQDFIPVETNSPDLDDPIEPRAQSRGLEVKRHQCLLHWP